jgi:hypothetical protein
MKRINLFSVMLLTAMLFAIPVKAQVNNFHVDEKLAKNLINGIKSSNEGLKRSCIYFAGKYNVTYAVDALIDCLKKEKDQEIRILAVISLYEIRDARGLEAVRNQSIIDENERVRQVSSLVFTEYFNNSNLEYVPMAGFVKAVK